MARASFDLAPGHVLGNKYEVVEKLGSGYEGEVYRVIERRTGGSRAAKLFYPERNVRDRAVNFYAKKLERLRKCPLVVGYHHVEPCRVNSEPVSVLISEYIEGQILTALLRRRRSRRFELFEALCLLHALASGVAEIHAAREYHGDLHAENVQALRRGVRWEVRVLDFWDWGRPTRATQQDDVVGMIQIFHETLGGRKHYRSLPQEAKAICRGLRRDLILERFPSARRLAAYLETFEWS